VKPRQTDLHGVTEKTELAAKSDEQESSNAAENLKAGLTETTGSSTKAGKRRQISDNRRNRYFPAAFA
jgi:hypothetical protein